MWIQRTPEEISRRQKSVEKEALSQGWIFGVLGWLAVVVVTSTGWLFCLQFGIVAESRFGGTFWSRLPVFAVIGLPIIFLTRRSVSKGILEKAARRTICPKCDTPSEGNAGETCKCGGAFIATKEMKWVDIQESADPKIK